MKKDPAQMSDQELAVICHPQILLGGVTCLGFLLSSILIFVVGLSYSVALIPLVFLGGELFQWWSQRRKKAPYLNEYNRRFSELRDFNELIAEARAELAAQTAPGFIVLFKGRALPHGGVLVYRLVLDPHTKTGKLKHTFIPFDLERINDLKRTETALSSADVEVLLKILETRDLKIKEEDCVSVRDGLPFEICILGKDTARVEHSGGNVHWTEKASSNPAVQLVKFLIER